MADAGMDATMRWCVFVCAFKSVTQNVSFSPIIVIEKPTNVSFMYTLCVGSIWKESILYGSLSHYYTFCILSITLFYLIKH